MISRRRPRPQRGAERRAALRRARMRRSTRSARRGRPSSSTTARRTARSPRSTRLHAAHDERPRRPAAPQLRQGGGARAPASRRRSGDVVVTIDGDLQDDPAEIPQLLAKLDEGFDLVSGWKTQRRDPLGAARSSRGSSTASPAGVSGVAPARHELRPQGLPRRGRARPARSTASCTASSRCSRTTAASASPSCRSTTARASTAARATASSATCAASSTC